VSPLDHPGATTLGDAPSWVDASTYAVLQLIAEGVTELAGFEVAAISVVRDQDFEVVAVSGDEDARHQLEGSRTPVSMTIGLMAIADAWGSLMFVPHDRAGNHLGLNDWVPEFTPLDVPDAWHPEDMLFAPIFDTHGVLQGVVSVDLPTDGRRPGPDRRRMIEKYALQAGRAVVTAVDREKLTDQLQMATRARNVVREASRELSLDRLLVECQSELVAGFRAMGMWIHTINSQLGGSGSASSASSIAASLPRQLVDLTERGAHHAWSARRADIVSAHRVEGSENTPAEIEIILTYLASIGVASILFVPLGEGARCLGAMVFTRGFDDPEWSDGEIAVALDVGNDLGHAISHARAFEREQRLVRELQAVDSYKTELVATLSHELKTPLTSILGNLGLLEELEDMSEDGLHSLAAIDRSAQRIVRVVDDLMLLAKVGDPVHQIYVRPVDLGAVVDDVLALIEVDVLRRRLDIKVRRPHDPVLATGDADEIDRAIANIVSNATKYTPEGGRIVITLEQQENEVVFTCTDDGIGIAEADLPLLFREFFRSTNPSALRVPGTGLGLAIVERIVHRHGGRIQVTSVPDVGSTFTVVLPAATGEPPRELDLRTEGGS
jgi:signal transduction histidine kinase